MKIDEIILSSLVIKNVKGSDPLDPLTYEFF